MKMLWSLILSIILIMASTTASSEDINIKGRFGIGIIGGLAIPTGDPIDRYTILKTYTGSHIANKGTHTTYSDSDIAGVYGLDIFYGLRERIALDLCMLHYRKTSIKVDGDEWGDVSTISLIPSVQLRFPLQFSYLVPQPITLTPYIDFGIGININSFNESSYFVREEDVIMKNSLAIKIGGGVDYLFKKNISFSMMLDWIYNRADTYLDIIENNKGYRYGSWETDLSAFHLLFGIRYLF